MYSSGKCKNQQNVELESCLLALQRFKLISLIKSLSFYNKQPHTLTASPPPMSITLTCAFPTLRFTS